MSPIESRSKVAQRSGEIAKATIVRIAKWRFTVCGKAVNMPTELIVTEWFTARPETIGGLP
jgi:hypothetical protein